MTKYLRRNVHRNLINKNNAKSGIRTHDFMYPHSSGVPRLLRVLSFLDIDVTYLLGFRIDEMSK